MPECGDKHFDLLVVCTEPLDHEGWHEGPGAYGVTYSWPYV